MPIFYSEQYGIGVEFSVDVCSSQALLVQQTGLLPVVASSESFKFKENDAQGIAGLTKLFQLLVVVWASGSFSQGWHGTFRGTRFA
jgi:hypothetical protein